MHRCLLSFHLVAPRYGKYLEDIKNPARGEVTWGKLRADTGHRDTELWNPEGALEFILSDSLILLMRKQRQLDWAQS